MNDNRKDQRALPPLIAIVKLATLPLPLARSQSPATPRFLLPAPRLPPRPNPLAAKRAPVPQLLLLPKSTRVSPAAKPAGATAVQPNGKTEPEPAAVGVVTSTPKNTSA